MNWKVLSLSASLLLMISLTACSSSPETNNQVAPGTAPSAAPAVSSPKPGDAMNKDSMNKDSMGKDKPADAMNKDSMSKDKPGDAMEKPPATTTP